MANTDTTAKAALAIATGGTAATEYVEALQAFEAKTITITELVKASIALTARVGIDGTAAVAAQFLAEQD